MKLKRVKRVQLAPPCTYQGGKQRVSKEIIDYIFNSVPVNKNTKFFDLCCGSGAITIELLNRGIKPKNITMLDKFTNKNTYIANW